MMANERKPKYYAFGADGPNGEKLESKTLRKLPNSEVLVMDMRISMKDFKYFLENEFEWSSLPSRVGAIMLLFFGTVAKLGELGVDGRLQLRY